MKLELSIPTQLSEISLEQYQKFLKVAKENEESEFLHQKMVQIFCGIELKDVAKIKHRDVVEITATLGALFNANHKYISTFKMRGIEFGFIPNLDEMSQGEYVDLDTYIGNWDDMHRAMAVLYRPIITKSGNRYSIEDYNGSEAYSDIMKDAPLNVVLGAMVFFYHLGNDLLINTLTYLEQNQTVMNIVNKHNSESDGDGIIPSMHSLKETLEDLMKFQSFPYTNASLS
jgi:hypothetical protein